MKDSSPLAELRAEFQRRGFHLKATGPIVGELALHVLCSLGGSALFVAATRPLWQALGLLIMTLGNVGVATNTHSASHYAASARRWVNDLLTYFGYPFFLNMSATYWRHQHIKVHHQHPNVIGVDDDVDFTPWFAMTEQEIQASRGFRRTFLLRYQFLVFPLVAWANGFTRQKSGYRYLLSVLRDPARRKPAHLLDAAALALHWLAWYIVPSLFFPVTSVLLFNLLRIALLGYPLFCVLAPGHYPEMARCVEKGDWATDFVLLQTAATINFRTGPIGRLLCSGLEYQIEHHLFPTYSHTHYRAMSPLVRAYCERRGYEYRTLGWAEAVWLSLRVFYRPKRALRHIDELRRAA